MSVETKPRVLTPNISLDDGTASIELAFEVADYFKWPERVLAGYFAKSTRS